MVSNIKCVPDAKSPPGRKFVFVSPLAAAKTVSPLVRELLTKSSTKSDCPATASELAKPVLPFSAASTSSPSAKPLLVPSWSRTNLNV